MNKVILDSSALLALLNQETGHEMVNEHLSNAIMSTVNITEVLSVLTDLKMPFETAKEIVMGIINDPVPFDLEQAFISASMKTMTNPYGLSLGDRACLALTKLKNLPVLTADKIWKKLDDNEFNIILIR